MSSTEHPTDRDWRALRDNEVGEPRRAELERHLVICSTCTERFLALL
jgi:hypothetical protein